MECALHQHITFNTTTFHAHFFVFISFLKIFYTAFSSVSFVLSIILFFVACSSFSPPTARLSSMPRMFAYAIFLTSFHLSLHGFLPPPRPVLVSFNCSENDTISPSTCAQHISSVYLTSVYAPTFAKLFLTITSDG